MSFWSGSEASAAQIRSVMSSFWVHHCGWTPKLGVLAGRKLDWNGLNKSNNIIYWLVVSTYPSEKYEFVSWAHYSQYMERHKSHVPNHQSFIYIIIYIYIHIIYIYIHTNTHISSKKIIGKPIPFTEFTMWISPRIFGDHGFLPFAEGGPNETTSHWAIWWLEPPIEIRKKVLIT